MSRRSPEGRPQRAEQQPEKNTIQIYWYYVCWINSSAQFLSNFCKQIIIKILFPKRTMRENNRQTCKNDVEYT